MSFYYLRTAAFLPPPLRGRDERSSLLGIGEGGTPRKTCMCGTPTPDPSERALLVSTPQGGMEKRGATNHAGRGHRLTLLEVC